jgi:hypothetical protein
VVITGDDKTVELTLSELLMTASGNETRVQAGRVAVDNGSGSSILSPARLVLDAGDGKSNALTAEEAVITDGSNMSVVKADEVSIQNGSGDLLSLNPQEVKVSDDGGNYASVSPEGGFRSLYDGLTARMFIGSVKLDDGAGGTVDITPIPSKTISLQDTASCEAEEGVSVPKTAFYLRSESVAP